MLERILSDLKNIEDYQEFPVIVTKPEIIAYTLPDPPERKTHKEPQYVMLVYLFHQGKKYPKHKIVQRWKQGYQIAFSTDDYYFETGKDYCLETTIYIKNGRQVMDRIFIKIR